MTVVEAPVPVLTDDLDIPDMHSHLYSRYPSGSERIAHCGLPVSKDPHVSMHRAQGDSSPCEFHPGETQCPRCGAPICPDCLKGT